MKSILKQLVKVSVVLSAMVAGSAWAQQCGGGFMDAQGMCHNTSMGSVPMGTQGVGGSYPSNGGSGYSYPAAPALRSSFGAVAFDPTTSSYGYANKQASKQASIQAALNDCGSRGCKIVSTYSNQCVALAGGDKYVATGSNINPKLAAQKALKNCSAKTRNCQILVSECSLPS